MPRYLFSGRVFPERANIHFPRQEGILSGEGFPDHPITIEIGASQIFAEVQAESAIDDLATLKNRTHRSIQTMIDSFAYLHGFNYRAEITSVVDHEGRYVVFGVGDPTIEEKLDYEEREAELTKILSIYNRDPDAGKFLQLALSDLSSALERPSDTGFFCFRAIESLRQYFLEEGDADADSWRKLRTELDVERPYIDEVHDLSNDRRHGDYTELSYEERSTALDHTWEILRKFIEFHAAT